MKSLGRYFLAALFVGFVLSSVVHAQTVPFTVQNNLNALTAECLSHDGKRRGADAKPLTPVDLNGDGILDWVLDTGDLDCESAGMNCGTGGCLTLIFISHGAGHTLVWEDQLRSWRATVINGRPGLLIDLHGSACNKIGAEPCPRRFVFQGSRLVRVR